MTNSEMAPVTRDEAMQSSSLLGFAAEAQGRVARAFVVSPADREATVSGILARVPREATGYWLRLMLAMGIATLGRARLQSRSCRS